MMLNKAWTRREVLYGVVQLSVATALISPSEAKHILANGFAKLKIDQNWMGWNRLLSDNELATLTKFVDQIIPEHNFLNSKYKTVHCQSASQAGVVEFLNEWVSAPFENHKQDLMVFKTGLKSLNKLSSQKFNKQAKDLNNKEWQEVLNEAHPFYLQFHLDV